MDTLGNESLIGDFVAILSSAVCAVYNNYCGLAIAKDKDKDKDKCPLSVYLSLMALIVIVFSVIASYVNGNAISIFSMSPTSGLFGFFASGYSSSLPLP